jgi:hypothetical protein
MEVPCYYLQELYRRHKNVERLWYTDSWRSEGEVQLLISLTLKHR